MKLLPMFHGGVVLMHEDGGHELAVLQVFRLKDGETAVRLGRNIFFFNAAGGYAGSEYKTTEATDLPALVEAMNAAGGQRPAEAYYPEGSAGYAREIAGWPAAKNTH